MPERDWQKKCNKQNDKAKLMRDFVGCLTIKYCSPRDVLMELRGRKEEG